MREFPSCGDLVTFVAERGIIKRFSRNQLRESGQEAIVAIERIPVNLDGQQEAKVRKFLAEVEAARLARMGAAR
jgi:hypothetical protein